MTIPEPLPKAPGTAAKAPETTPANSTENPPMPEMGAATTLELPELKLSDESSVTHQLNKLTGKDSIMRQQAEVGAHERGVASGTIASSQQAGAAATAVQQRMEPLAIAEANRAATRDMSNWQSKVSANTQNWQQQNSQNMQKWQTQYAGRLTEMGFNNQRVTAMQQANTALTQSMMQATSSLLNNPDIQYGPEVNAKLMDVMNTGQDNNNLILNMGFSY